MIKVVFFDLDGTIVYRADQGYSYISGLGRDRLIEELKNNDMCLMPYTLEFLKLLKSKDIKRYIVSNSYDEDVKLVLDHFKISKYLKIISFDLFNKGDRIAQVLSGLRLNPKQALFVDNQIEHLSDAEEKNPNLNTVFLKSDIYLNSHWRGKNKSEYEKTFFHLYKLFLDNSNLE